MKIKAIVTNIEEGKAILKVGSENIGFPLESLPSVTPGNVLSLKIKVENSHNKERDEEALGVMSAILDRSCEKPEG